MLLRDRLVEKLLVVPACSTPYNRKCVAVGFDIMY